jgi:hypothetical protein
MADTTARFHRGLFGGRRLVGGAVLGVKQDDLARVWIEHDFGGGAGLAALLPLARFKLALDVQLRAFPQVLFDDADKPQLKPAVIGIMAVLAAAEVWP